MRQSSLETGSAGGVRIRHSRDGSQSSFDQTTEWIELHPDREVFSVGKKNTNHFTSSLSCVHFSPNPLNSYPSVPQADRPTGWLEMCSVVHLHLIMTLPCSPKRTTEVFAVP